MGVKSLSLTPGYLLRVSQVGVKDTKLSVEKQILTIFVSVANSIFLLFFFDFRNYETVVS